MGVWLNVVVSGLLMGSFYGLVALGLGIVFGVMSIANFAHGALLTVAMFLVYGLVTLTGIDPYLAIIPAALVMYVLGKYLQRWLISPVLRREKDTAPLTLILLTAGLGWALSNGMLFLFSANYRTVDTAYSGQSLFIGDISIPVPRLIGLVVATIIVGGLQWFLTSTDLGRALRATSQDREAARLMGIDDFKIYEFAFGLGTALVGVTACLLVPFYFVHPTVGDFFAILALITVVLGGLGSILGTFLGGLFVGLVEAVGAHLFSLYIGRVLVFALFVAVLLWRPAGLFGRRL